MLFSGYMKPSCYFFPSCPSLVLLLLPLSCLLVPLFPVTGYIFGIARVLLAIFAVALVSLALPLLCPSDLSVVLHVTTDCPNFPLGREDLVHLWCCSSYSCCPYCSCCSCLPCPALALSDLRVVLHVTSPLSVSPPLE